MRAPVSLAILALAAACESGPPPEEALVDRVETLSFGDVANLGPHRMEAALTRTDRRAGLDPSVSEEQAILVWAGWDDFELRRVRDGRTRVHVLVRGGSLWKADKQGTLVPGGDPEPWRADLRLAWDPWSAALGPFQERIRFLHEEDGTLEGRTARRYRVEVPPQGLDEPLARVRPQALEGKVWLDALTAVPLMAEIRGRWTVEGEGDRVREVALVMARSAFGTATPAAPPEPSSVPAARPSPLDAPRRPVRP